MPAVNRRKALSAERSRRHRARQARLRRQLEKEDSDEARQRSLNLLRDFRASQLWPRRHHASSRVHQASVTFRHVASGFPSHVTPIPYGITT
jgi:hypothetical protein